MLGIIGGTGLTQLTNLQITRRQLIRTPYGEPSSPLTFGEISGHTVVFWRVMAVDIQLRHMR